MGVAHVGLVHRDPCECKVKGFCAVSSIERNVSKRRHLQGERQFMLTNGANPSAQCRRTLLGRSPPARPIGRCTHALGSGRSCTSRLWLAPSVSESPVKALVVSTSVPFLPN